MNFACCVDVIRQMADKFVHGRNSLGILQIVAGCCICVGFALECHAQAPAQSNPYREVEPRPAAGAQPAARVATRLPSQSGQYPPSNAHTAAHPPQQVSQQPAAPSLAAAGTAAADQQDRIAAVILVKNALIAVNQGNLTGNFTVLRDLASPGFRTKNSAGDLAVIFNKIRQQKVDLSPVVVMEPVMGPPRKTEDGQILLEGYFPSQPLRINFQLLFQRAESGGWMINGVSVNAATMDGISANSPGAPSTIQRPAATMVR